MIYESRPTTVPLSQGDIFEQCPIVFWSGKSDLVSSPHMEISTSVERVIVLTQACDLANAKTSKVQIAIIHETGRLIANAILKPQTIRDQVRRHLVYGWYFLPAGEGNPESIVDLHDIHTVPRGLLEHQIEGGYRKCGMSTPYREHLLQHFATTYSRIALPQPYETLPE